MEANPPELKRDGTMQVTAQEGAEFLKRSGAEDLIPTVDGEGDAKPEIQRETTMEATLKEGEAFLEATGKPAEEVRTRGEQEELDAGDAPAIPRDNTMQVTAKEGAEILGDEALGSTRAETEALRDAEGGDVEGEDDDDEVDEEDDEGEDEEEENGEEENGEEEDRANLKRTITMTETVAEGEDFLKRQKTNGEATEESAPAEAEAAS